MHRIRPGPTAGTGSGRTGPAALCGAAPGRPRPYTAAPPAGGPGARPEEPGGRYFVSTILFSAAFSTASLEKAQGSSSPLCHFSVWSV